MQMMQLAVGCRSCHVLVCVVQSVMCGGLTVSRNAVVCRLFAVSLAWKVTSYKFLSSCSHMTKWLDSSVFLCQILLQ